MNISTHTVTSPISMEHDIIEIACFITPHGFGHATRMTAVLEALQKQSPTIHPHLFTTVPESLFAEKLSNFSYHSLACDIGLIQKNGLQADLPATISRLQEFLPFDSSLVKELSEKIKGSRLVLCDIAPLGIAVAREAGITSVLIENFTWDWIYKAYLPDNPALLPFIESFATHYKQVDLHIRTEPACSTGNTDLNCGPIFRNIRSQREKTRDKLNCRNKKLIIISMGGIDLELPFVNKLPAVSDSFFLLAGQKKTRQIGDNVLLLSRDSAFYHPDLINAANLVICKSGYSTVAECYQAGVPIVTVGRTTFPESAVLEQFCAARLNGHTLRQEAFLSGEWIKSLDKLCLNQRAVPALTNGADSVAELLLCHLGKKFLIK